MRVAVLIPAYQAAAQIGEVLVALHDLPEPPHVLVVDDGSRDATGEVARQHGAQVHTFAGNRGKGHALLEGFRLLGAFDGVITIDADGQHPPACVPDLIAAFQPGVDLVLGTRARSAAMPATRRLANGFASGWATLLAGQRVSDSQCGYRLYGRKLLDRTPVTPGRYEVETEIVVRAARLGFRFVEVDVPTVYGEEKSQIRAFHDVPRIVGTLMRLTGEGLIPPQVMRAARRNGSGGGAS